MKYENVFKKGSIGKLELKNRVIMPPMGTHMASAIGEVTDHMIAYYSARAKGGVGLIISEIFAIDYITGKTGPSNPRIDEPGFILMLQRLADTVHQYGAKLFIQLQHPGCQTTSYVNNGNQILSPSGVQSMVLPDTPRALTIEEIKEFVGKFVTGAVNCKAAGADGIEIHGAHGYLVSQFLSPHFNKRTDEYGGSFENRMRFAREIIEGIRVNCGPDFPICIRLNIEEFLDDGVNLEEGVRIAKYMEDLGVDAISSSCTTYETMENSIEPISYEQGWRVYLAEAVKKAVKIQVITAGVIREPQIAENIIKEGKADFVAIARGHLADPDWCNKAASGRENEIRKYIACLTCFEEILAGHRICCAVNARTGNEWQYGKLEKNGQGRKVVVVGGGPAGVEAARVLAEREFKVVLFEKRPELGGQLNYASRPLGKAKINWLIEYGRHELKRLNVDVRLNTEADFDVISKEEPYAIFLATGGNPVIPGIKGVDLGNVFSAEDVLAGKEDIQNETVAVIGGGMTGCETAVLIASWGNRVSVLEMLPEICNGVMIINKLDAIKFLDEYKVNILTNSQLEEVKPGSVTLRNLETGESSELEAGKVVLALGVSPENSLYSEIADKFSDVFLLGDAVKVRKIAHAVREGYIGAMLLQ